MKATTVQEFFELEVPKSKTGKVLWHAQARSAISLRQLLQTDTIEFRHFPGVLIGSEFMTALEWCTDFLIGAIDGSYTARELFDGYYADRKFPTLDSIYCHWQEKRWLATSCSKNNRETREKNVAKILRGEFDDHIDDTPHLRLSNPRGVDCY